MLFTINTTVEDPLNHDVCEDEDNVFDLAEPEPVAVSHMKKYMVGCLLG